MEVQILEVRLYIVSIAHLNYFESLVVTKLSYLCIVYLFHQLMNNEFF